MVRQNTARSRFRGQIPEEDKKVWNRPDATENYEGGLAFRMDALTEAYTRVASCFFQEPKFYKETDQHGRIVAQNQDDDLLKLIRGIAREDPQFVMQLAAYARNELYLRTIPVILWVEAAMVRKKQNNKIIRDYAPSILKRADEPAEAIAYFIARNASFLGDGGRYPNDALKGVVLSHSLRKGIEDAIFANFDRYQVAKYDRTNAAVKWRDVINLVHPKPRGEEWQKIFKDVLAKTIEPAETWEDTLMRWKEKGFKSKKDAWQSIIPKMGYMALLRNLRNMSEQGIDEESMTYVINKLKDPEEVKRSKQFPYRFHSAYKVLEQISVGKNTQLYNKFQTALEDALETSVNNNLPKWKGTTYIAADWSASMNATRSSKSAVSNKEIAGLLMCMAHKLCENSICTIFGQNHALVTMHERSGILDNLGRILTADVGHSTNAWLAVDYLLAHGIKVDRFVLFSDMQCYDSRDKAIANPTNYRMDGDRIIYDYPNVYGYSHRSEQIAPKWNRYKQDVNPNAYMYSFDLAGYGTSQLPQDTDRLFIGAGFSDRILEFVPLFEQSDKNTAIAKIRSITPDSYRKQRKAREDGDGRSISNQGRRNGNTSSDGSRSISSFGDLAADNGEDSGS